MLLEHIEEGEEEEVTTEEEGGVAEEGGAEEEEAGKNAGLKSAVHASLFSFSTF